MVDANAMRKVGELMSPDRKDRSQEVEMMYVQTARGSSFEGSTLTLDGIAPSTLYFSDRPERVVGYVTAEDFVGLWGEGENGFAENPPNAVLALLESGDDVPEDAVVALRDPTMQGDSLAYARDLLEGSPPLTSGPCTLFIDPLGRPLSPVSIAGVHRRSRRRARRRGGF